MRVSFNFALPLAALLFVFLLVPQAALAGAANCPHEPATNVPIASGGVYAGTNCTLNTPGDVDSFVFKGNSGETWQLVAGINSTSGPDICLTLYPPTPPAIFYGCTNIYHYPYPSSVGTDQKLTVSGSYTVVITEAGSGTVNYGVSLERLYPFPPDAQPITLEQVVATEIIPLTEQDTFTFKGATTGTYRASATETSGDHDVCIAVYFPDGTSAGSGCTNIYHYPYPSTVQIDFTPPVNGTILVQLAEAGNAGTVSYTMEVSCVVGKCPPPPPPPCTLIDKANYNATSSTLTMYFTVGNKVATTWNAWLTSQTTMTPLSGFPIAQQITKPPVSIKETTSLSPEGTVGILSTLTTPTKGIICSSWVPINTGP